MFGPRTTEFLKGLGHRLRQVFHKARGYISCCLMGQAASVLKTMNVNSVDEDCLHKYCLGVTLMRQNVRAILLRYPPYTLS